MNIDELFSVIDKRVKNKTKNSYTNKLLSLGPKKIAQKSWISLKKIKSRTSPTDKLQGTQKYTRTKILQNIILESVKSGSAGANS